MSAAIQIVLSDVAIVGTNGQTIDAKVISDERAYNPGTPL